MKPYHILILILSLSKFDLSAIAMERILEQDNFGFINYEYIITDTCDLQNKKIEIPDNCTVKFNFDWVQMIYLLFAG